MFGKTKTSPWTLTEEDLAYIAVVGNNWEESYPEIDASIDVVQSAANFYLLFGMVSGGMIDYEPVRLPSRPQVLRAAMQLGMSLADLEARDFATQKLVENDPRQELTAMADEAQVLFDELIARLDISFMWYLHLACGGELRHHIAIGGGKVLSSVRKIAWTGWRKIFNHYGVDALLEMSKLFRETGKGGYGGPLWADGSDILYARLTGTLGPDFTTNRFLFVDRVFTLEHNGGCFLNKITWGNNRTNHTKGWGLGAMQQTVLKAHSAEVPDFDTLYGAASENVQELVMKYLTLAEQYSMRIKGKWNPNNKQVQLIDPEPTVETDEIDETDWIINEDIWGVKEESVDDVVVPSVKKPNWSSKGGSLLADKTVSKKPASKPHILINLDSPSLTYNPYKNIAQSLVKENSLFTAWPHFSIDHSDLYAIHFTFADQDGVPIYTQKYQAMPGAQLVEKKFHWKMMLKGYALPEAATKVLVAVGIPAFSAFWVPKFTKYTGKELLDIADKNWK